MDLGYGSDTTTQGGQTYTEKDRQSALDLERDLRFRIFWGSQRP